MFRGPLRPRRSIELIKLRIPKPPCRELINPPARYRERFRNKKEASAGSPLMFTIWKFGVLVQIEVVLQFHPHGYRMAILGRGHEPDVLGCRDRSLCQSIRQAGYSMNVRD
jgi:hypothetical protein